MRRAAIAALLAAALSASGCTHRMAQAVLAGALIGGSLAAISYAAEEATPRRHRHTRWCGNPRHSTLFTVGSGNHHRGHYPE